MPVTRQTALLAGGVVLVTAWSGGLARFAPGPFSAHMAVHIAVVALAAPLVAIAVAGSRIDPARRVSALVAPIPASIVELMLAWAWHAPALHAAARASVAVYVVEQASFLLAGLLLWIAVSGGTTTGRAARSGAGVAALLFTSMHMTLLGALFALTPRVLYAHGHGGEAALFDQHAGGIIMLLVGGGSYLAGGLWLMTRVLAQDLVPRKVDV